MIYKKHLWIALLLFLYTVTGLLGARYGFLKKMLSFHYMICLFIRLNCILCVLFYIVLFEFYKDESSLNTISSALIWGALFQIGILVVYVYCSWLGFWPIPNPDFFISNSFAERFSVHYSDVIVPRFFGTTHEPAPYGLYGYTDFFVFLF